MKKYPVTYPLIAGHGTNARGVETTATYDSARGEFVITSPTPSASKYWPGNILGAFTLGFSQP